MQQKYFKRFSGIFFGMGERRGVFLFFFNGDMTVAGSCHVMNWGEERIPFVKKRKVNYLHAMVLERNWSLLVKMPGRNGGITKMSHQTKIWRNNGGQFLGRVNRRMGPIMSRYITFRFTWSLSGG